MRWFWFSLVVVTIVAAGCSSKSEKKSGDSGVHLTLSTTCTPNGGTYRNDTTVNVTLTVNRTGATIHYGVDDPDASSVAVDTVSFPVTGSDITVTVYYWSEWTDPDTGNVEFENGGIPKQASFEFTRDVSPPTISIEPAGGVFGDRGDVNPITITATDAETNVTIYYRTQEDSGGWSDWQTAGGSAKTETHELTWQDGVILFEVEAYAEDETGKTSDTVSETYEFDLDAMARKVLDLINQKRDEQSPPLPPLEWDQGIADACKTHAEQLALAIDNGGDPSKFSPGDEGDDGKTLSDRTSYRFAFGTKGATTAEQAFNVWWDSTSDNWSPTGGWGDPDGEPDMQQWMLSTEVTRFGCGFETKYWIWIAALR